jgi:hypothetical protein
MKKLLIVFAGFIMLVAFTGNRNENFKKLYALQGTWQMTTKRGILCEEWKKINDNYLQSKGYIVKGTDTLINETVALTKKGDDIFYTSTIVNQNDQQPVAFKMTKSGNNIFVFENAQHDFPKRIVYQLLSADSLYAFIDDGIDGSAHKQNFYYKRYKK